MTVTPETEQLLVNLCVLDVESETIAELNGINIHGEDANGRIEKWIMPWDSEFTLKDFQAVRYDCEIHTGGEMPLAHGKWLTYNTVPQPVISSGADRLHLKEKE